MHTVRVKPKLSKRRWTLSMLRLTSLIKADNKKREKLKHKRKLISLLKKLLRDKPKLLQLKL